MKISPRSSKAAQPDRSRPEAKRGYATKQPNYVPTMGPEKRITPPKKIKP